MITLRKLALDHPDIPKVWKLFQEAFHESERELLYSLLEFPEATLYGIYPDDQSGKFIGFFVVLDDGSVAFMYYFAICPEMRSAGIGGEALRALVEMCRGRQVTLLYESVRQPGDDAEQRERRRAFYLRNGFHESSEYYSYEDTEYVLAGSEEPVDTDAVLRLFSRYEGELFA